MSNKGDISEIFVSIQGEGIFVGVRQLFIRFSRCNLRCWYCDTELGSKVCRDFITGIEMENPVSSEYVSDVIGRDLRVHSVSLTGGEPLLYADFIRSIDFHGRRVYLETNMTLPEEAKKLRFVDFVAGDLKIREAFGCEVEYDEILNRTVRCFKVLRNTSRRRTFCKIVLPPEFDVDDILSSAEQIGKYVSSFVLQPVFGTSVGDKIFELQEKLIELGDTRIIPQVHKLMGLK